VGRGRTGRQVPELLHMQMRDDCDPELDGGEAGRGKGQKWGHILEL
jgi:hypothetical protein